MKSVNWMQLIIGFWIMISPWVLGCSDIKPILWSNLIIGTIVSLSAFWKIVSDYSQKS